MIWVWVIVAAYSILVLYVIGKVFRYVHNPSKTLAWLMVVMFVPVFGIIFYFLIGRSPKKDKFFLKRSPFYRLSDSPGELRSLPRPAQKLGQLMHKNKSAALSFGNRIKILQNGEETFKDIHPVGSGPG